jgi:hypothetical protein
VAACGRRNILCETICSFRDFATHSKLYSENERAFPVAYNFDVSEDLICKENHKVRKVVKSLCMLYSFRHVHRSWCVLILDCGKTKCSSLNSRGCM